VGVAQLRLDARHLDVGLHEPPMRGLLGRVALIQGLLHPQRRERMA